MGVSFRWAPSTAGKSLRSGSSSDFEALKAVFGSPPWELTEADLPVLKGMAMVPGFAGVNLYKELLDLVEKHGSIKVWGEW